MSVPVGKDSYWMEGAFRRRRIFRCLPPVLEQAEELSLDVVVLHGGENNLSIGSCGAQLCGGPCRCQGLGH